MRLISTTVTRLGAALVLLALLVGVPIATVALVGIDVGSLSGALDTGRLSTAAVVQIGLAVFLLLWVWFAVTALSEVARVVRWRRAPRAVSLRPTLPSPTGWVRGLVRVAMISSAVVVVPHQGGGSMSPYRPVTVLAEELTGSGSVAAVPSTLRSNGRETPYSIAARLGDPGLRDTIIDLNRGRAAPDGTPWSSGVFPDGMMVAVPEGSLAPPPTPTWVTHTVSEGESVYRIAAALAAGDGRRVRDLADQIIDRNIGRTMADGRLFDDPSLIRPGWTLDVPATGTPAPARHGPAVHVVAAGESYWTVAAAAAPAADPAEVLRLTTALVAENAPRLRHDDALMLHPGDELVMPAPVPMPVSSDLPPVAVDGPVGTPETPATVPAAVPATVPAAVMVTAEPDVVTTALPVAALPTPVAGTVVTELPAPVPGTAAPAPAPAAAPAAPSAVPGAQAPIGRNLGGALLLCAGALGLVEVRRRHQLRRATSGSFVPDPPPAHVRTERILRSLGASERAVRLDLALRSAGHALGGSGGFVRAAILSDAGDVTVLLDRPGHLPPGVWSADRRADRWFLAAEVSTDQLVDTARLAGQPCPAVVHVGALVADGGYEASGDVFVDLEAFGVLSIDGPADDTDAVLQSFAASLAMSPVGEDLHVVTHDVDMGPLTGARLASADDLDAALDLAVSFIGSTPTVAGSRRTFELRSRGIGGETWEPVVVLSGGPAGDPLLDGELTSLASGGRGIAVVVGHPLDDAAASLVAGPSGWHLRPLDLVVIPAGVTVVDLEAVVDLVTDADSPLPHAPLAEPALGEPRPDEPGSDGTGLDGTGFVEPDWALMVRLLGGVRVVDRVGQAVRFERGKALELVAWLATHRTRSTRASARAALWDLDVRDATFANVVSDARRALARAVPPADGDEWIGRTLTEHLPLHDLVVTDVDVLRARLEAARGRPAREAVAILEPGVALVDGLPFSGGDHLWTDAEGITSSLIVLATGAAAELARHYLALGDIDGVFRSTGRGLAVLGGHEELIGLRMRAHAMRGNLAGVRHEWAFYERALDADPWSTSDPSPSLVSLRKELLSS